MDPQPRNLAQLATALESAWLNIPENTFRDLSDSSCTSRSSPLCKRWLFWLLTDGHINVTLDCVFRYPFKSRRHIADPVSRQAVGARKTKESDLPRRMGLFRGVSSRYCGQNELVLEDICRDSTAPDA
ncbi:DDE_3 domain-containing protein [Trichonephila clavipes]|nr:DDE_3 domain-containing protein [Trichonephila clavipes]